MTTRLASIVFTSLVFASALVGCTEQDIDDLFVPLDEADVKISLGGSVAGLPFTRGKAVFHYPDGTAQVRELDERLIVRVPIHFTRVEVEVRYSSFSVSGSVVVDDGGTEVPVEIGVQSYALPENPIAKHLISPFAVPEGETVHIVVGLHASDSFGHVSGIGSFETHFDPIELEPCLGTSLCADVPVTWNGAAPLRIELDDGANRFGFDFQIRGTWSDVTTDRVVRFADVIDENPDGTYKELSDSTQMRSFLGISFLQWSVMNAIVREVNFLLLHNTVPPDLLAGMLGMSATHPVAYVGDTAFFSDPEFVEGLVPATLANYLWLGTRFALHQFRDAPTGVVKEQCRDTLIRTALGAQRAIQDEMAPLLPEFEALQAQYEAELLKQKPNKAELERIGKEIDARRPALEELAQKGIEIEQALDEAGFDE